MYAWLKINSGAVAEHRRNLINFLTFQLGWFGCVFYANDSTSVLSITAVALIVHGLFVVEDVREWLVIACVVAVGAAVDTLLGLTPVLNYGMNEMLPVWLFCLWVLFATLIHHGCRWMQQNLLLASVLAALFAPLSYWTGVKLTSASFGMEPLFSMVIIGACWALIFPASLYFSSRVLSDDSENYH